MTNEKAVAKKETNETACFGNTSGFDLLQRQAKLLASSSLVPEQFSFFGKDGKLKDPALQIYAQANAAIAIEMAIRIGASPIMVAQNLYIVHGRPSWSSQFIIAAINSSGKFSPLRFEITGEGDKKTCVAWALELKTGERLDSAPVSIDMAKKEGWYGKNGSKWQTMPDLMLRYRAASFFGRVYAPEILMGIKGAEEVEDFIDISQDIEIEYQENANKTLIDIIRPETINTDTGEVTHTETPEPTSAEVDAMLAQEEGAPY